MCVHAALISPSTLRRLTDGAGKLLPNDDTEQDRLDLLHHIFTMALGGNLCKTKLTNPQRILDVGTGTGIWAIDSNTT